MKNKKDKKALVYKAIIVNNKKYVLSELPKIELFNDASEDMVDKVFYDNKKTKKR